MRSKLTRVTALVGIVVLLAALSMVAFSMVASAELTDGNGATPDGSSPYSHRFIVVLESPPLAVKYRELPGARSAAGKLDVNAPASQSYIAQLQAEQAAFVAAMQQALPHAKVATYINEQGLEVEERFQIVMNAVVVDAGFEAGRYEEKVLQGLPGVQAVYRDRKYYPQLYTSTLQINADVAWNLVGGQAMAGKGVKVASLDGGIHNAAPMFRGDGWSYPSGYPAGGLGLTANNNGKIIVSRVYFRPWDPPAPGDENPWPGVNGTPHGVHTAGIAAGNIITDGVYAGAKLPRFSGVAPGAWVGSYRVFYASVRGDGSFHTAEGLAALEDIVKDGMDVLNNSWGGGPGSLGGEFDPLDQALRNAVAAGVFVSMSAGNAGPNPGTGDHPSDEYINVAASTTSGTYATGELRVTGPQPVTTTLQGPIPFALALFGPPPPFGQVLTYTYLAAANVDPNNATGCTAWPADTFKGKAALISRGDCFFANKVYYAQQAGAEFVIVYNTPQGGDTLIGMLFGCDYAPNCSASDITISSIFIGNTAGTAMVGWQQTKPNDAQFTLDMVARQVGNIPDRIAAFSSRGPSTRNTLKPDVAAPGVNIMSQGYTPGASGEARHLGFGQASGTSMAAPHVAGAAAVLKQAYPTWTPAQIKSALMSTAKFTDVYNFDGTPAQPIDMGAGRIDLGAAMDPGVLLDPPKADFGLVISGTGQGPQSVTIQVTNITTQAQTFQVSTLDTSGGFLPTQTTTIDGLSVAPTTLNLGPGETKSIQVTFDPAQGSLDINQGYILLDGTRYDAHLPFFARVVQEPLGGKDVLLIDVDFSPWLGHPDYSAYYLDALTNLSNTAGITFDYWDASALVLSSDTFVPSFPNLMKYKTVLLFTGDHFRPDGSFTVPTPLSAKDLDRLVEYANAGGRVIVMGQDASGVLDDHFFDDAILGNDQLQDSVTNNRLPTDPIVPTTGAPPAFQDLFLDLTGPNRALGKVELTGANEVPPVNNAGQITGTATFVFDNFTDELQVSIEIQVAKPYTITNAHIHSGTAGVNGPALHSLFPFTQPLVIADSASWDVSVTLTPEQQAQRLAGALYVNIHSSDNPAGEIRGQVPSTPVLGDGAGNQRYIDEMATNPLFINGNPGPSYPESDVAAFQALLRYAGDNNVSEGVVAMAHRDQPSLERPGVSYKGRSVYTSFGLEGVNNFNNTTTREALLKRFLDYLDDEPSATISVTQQVTTTRMVVVRANLSSNVGAKIWQVRWDWGDGSPYTVSPIAQAQHQYATCGTYTVRAEVTDTFGNRTIATQEVPVDVCAEHRLILPLIFNE